MRIQKKRQETRTGVSILSSVGWSFSPTSGQTAGTSMKLRASPRSCSSCPEVTGTLKIHPDVTRSLVGAWARRAKWGARSLIGGCNANLIENLDVT